MSICENPDISTVLAGPPLKPFREGDTYDMCLVDKSNEETPIPIYEFPNASDISTNRDIPTHGIFVIPYNRPETILVANPSQSYLNNKTVRFCRTQRNGRNVPVGKRNLSLSMIYHTYLTGALPVIAAGEYRIENRFSDKMTIKINNRSGHYFPSNNTLIYAQCLFEKKGYNVTVNNYSPKANENHKFFQNSRPLSYWMETPKEEWYPEEKAKPLGASGGGKRKTQKQKVRKQKTRRLRGKNI